MGLIPAIRTMPVADAGLASPSADTRADLRRSQERTAPVARTELPDAPLQMQSKPSSGEPHLLAARDTLETSAAATAEAARAAYIQASIAAGISPLPMP